MDVGRSFDFHVDSGEAERRKRARLIRIQTVIVPRLRIVGFALLAAAALLHNALVYPGWDAFVFRDWLRLVATLAAYSAVTWYLLYLFYEDLRRYLDLSAFFLACDMGMFSVVIAFTGAERSWIFFLPLFRVIDQVGTTFRRALVFAHLAPVSYGLVLADAVLRGHHLFAWEPEVAKLLLIYMGGWYVAMIARTGDARHRRSSEMIRMARDLIVELGDKSKALEQSSRQLHDALDQQADLHRENARLFSATEAREARLSQILHATSDGIVFVGRDGRIEAANVRAGDLLGFDRQSVIGMDIERVVGRFNTLGDGERFGSSLKALLAEPGPGGRGDLQQPATGRVLHWIAQPTPDTVGGTIGLTYTFQDVTPARDLVRQLEDKSRLLGEARRKAEDANRATAEVLASVTQQARTPLGAIIGLTGLVPDAEVARRIRAEAESLLAAIGDILDLSKIDSRTLVLAHEPMALRSVLTDVIETVRNAVQQKGLALSLEVAPETPDALVGDAQRLRQVLINLAANAIRFTESGDIRLRVDVASRLPREVCVHFAVIDSGPGIPRDKLGLIFEAFAQGDGGPAPRSGATTLGLAISARLVELMGGDIWVESEVGRGSAFRFTANFDL